MAVNPLRHPRPLEIPLSDYTNALAFIRDHGRDLRYCEAWKKWLLWTGTHWRHDLQAPVMQKAKATIKRLLRQGEHLDEDALSLWMKHIKRSLSTSALEAMVKSAQNEPGIPLLQEELNQHPFLLPCANGTLDLETGILRAHERADLLTECLTVDYDPDAICPVWDTFLWRIMGGSQGEDSPDMSTGAVERRQAANDRACELVAFLQRLFGHCLTGDVREQDLYVFHGTGANGKSTLINLLLLLLRQYAKKGTSELLMKTRTDRHTTERTDLFGKRLVATIETEEAGRLNETFIKEATGGDPITARRMREDNWTFSPTHKILLATNHRPEIRGTDHAIWRRIKLVPFEVTIPEDEQDATLPGKLQAELPGILAWMVRGCLAWQKDGLGYPAAVLDATQAYREEQDVFEGFLVDECHRVASASCSAADLYDAYEHWCKDNDVDAIKKRAFGIRLTDMGLIPDKGTGGKRLWRGIGLDAPEQTDKRSGA